MLSSILSRGKGDRQDLFQLYLERKEVSSCRLRGKLSSLLSRDVSFLERKEVSSCRLSGKRSSLLSHEVGGACQLSVVFEMGSSAFELHCMGGSSLLVEDEVENFYIVFEDWGSSVHVYTRSELS